MNGENFGLHGKLISNFSGASLCLPSSCLPKAK
jgi:hypothetical protein